jgi:hypothetical protein
MTILPKKLLGEAGGEWIGVGVDIRRGTWGRGQVMSWESCEQYSLILSYRYHCRDGDNPRGII